MRITPVFILTLIVAFAYFVTIAVFVHTSAAQLMFAEYRVSRLCHQLLKGLNFRRAQGLQSLGLGLGFEESGTELELYKAQIDLWHFMVSKKQKAFIASEYIFFDVHGLLGVRGI